MWIRESPYIGCEDDELIELAKTYDAYILTLDKDFGRIYYFRERRKITIFIIRVVPATSNKIMQALLNFLQYSSFEEFKNCLVVITIGKLRAIC